MHDLTNAGVVEIITFRAERTEHPYMESLKALLRGTSTGHIALRITFHNRTLFDKYIADYPGIHYRAYKEPGTNKDLYEVYLSFWPEGNWAPWHHLGDMRSYNYDCVQSGNFSGVEYSEQAAAYLQPLQKYARSSLPFFNKLAPSVISLPPTLIVHSSRLGIAYGDADTMQPNNAIVEAAEAFATKYHAWRVTLVNQHNASVVNPDNKDALAQLKRNAHIAEMRMLISKKHLKLLMFPNKTLNDDEFTQQLEPFMSFGYTERDIISLPLVYNGSEHAGIEIEPLLKFVRDIALDPAKFPYNVLLNNCAHIVWNMLWAGSKNSFFNDMKREFVLPWFVRWFNFTITPTMILHMALKIRSTILSIRSQQSLNLSDATSSHEANPATALLERNKTDYGLNSAITPLNFSKASAEVSNKNRFQDTDEDEIPTTRAEFYSQLMRNICGFLRC